MTPAFDSVLLAAFGGPTQGCCRSYASCPGEAHCFVEGVLGKGTARADHVQEVASRYQRIGGWSPFNFLTFKQAGALELALSQGGIRVPVFTGFRHWQPSLREVIKEMVGMGLRHTLVVIMAPHQSPVSWDSYQQGVAEGVAAVNGQGGLRVIYLDPWYAHPGFVEAIADRIRQAAEPLGEPRFREAVLIFTAHALPLSMVQASPYAQQFAATAAAVAAALGRERYLLAYQSQGRNTSQPWTEPDVNHMIRRVKGEGVSAVVISPIGFLCDHVEILYDLDVVARATAAQCGVHYIRAQAVASHPRFIDMLATLITQKFRG